MTQTALRPLKCLLRDQNLELDRRYTIFCVRNPVYLPASVRLFIGSFTNAEGQFTFENVVELFSQDYIRNSYLLSIQIQRNNPRSAARLRFPAGVFSYGGRDCPNRCARPWSLFRGWHPTLPACRCICLCCNAGAPRVLLPQCE